MSDYKSERTKKIEKAKIDDDMPAVKKAVRGAFLGLSRASDKVEGLFKKKDDKKEEEKKMATGGLSSSKALRKGGMPKKAFKPCPGCPSPAKCKAAGKCMMMEKKGTKKAAAGMLVIPVKMSKTPAKKKKK
jgi:hypothetical protein